MKIRKLNNGKASEACGQIGNRNFIGVDLKPVAFDKQRIAGYQCPDSPENTAFDELSSIHLHKNLSPALSAIRSLYIENDLKEWILFLFLFFLTPVKFASLHSYEYLTGQAGFSGLSGYFSRLSCLPATEFVQR